MSKTWLKPANNPPKREKVLTYPEYWKFVAWIATPTPLRRSQTQKELARELSVHEVTLSVWKCVDGFGNDVRREVRKWAGDSTGTIIAALRRNIIKNGNAAEVKLWLQWVEDWQEKSGIEQKVQVEEKKSEEDKQELLDAFDLAFYGKKRDK